MKAIDDLVCYFRFMQLFSVMKRVGLKLNYSNAFLLSSRCANRLKKSHEK